MKKAFLFLVSSFFLLNANAQVKRWIKPQSDLLSEKFSSTVSEIILPHFNLSDAERTDIIDEKNGEMPKFSRSVFTDITLDNSGEWTELADGSRVWRVHVTSKGAQALLPYFNKFYLPHGSTLHVYTPDKKVIIGAFTYDNNPADGYYAIGLIHGESCVLEYYEPQEERGKGVLSLNEVGHAYRWVKNYFPLNSRAVNDTLNGFGWSASCEVNVNCSEGAAWQDQKRAVVCIIVQSNWGQGICSGALINNARQNCTPYLLSAHHCSEGVTASNYSQFLFYFNYESPDCSNPTSIGTLGDYFVAGCTKKSDSNNGGGDIGSDFLLLQLNNRPPSSYNVFYAGWNNINLPSDSGVSIHHPEGDIKKISHYTTPLVDTTWGGTTGTHWKVRWSATVNGHGVTESGSSGSPLFNKQGQIIGTLTGGSAYCFNPTRPDYYGKVAFHWASNGTAPNRQLKPWLDPDNTGVTFINGRNDDCELTNISEVREQKLEMRVMPNPSSGNFYLSFHDENEKGITVYDALGQLMFEKKVEGKNFELDLSEFSNGVYLLLVSSVQGKVYKKLVLNH